MPEFYIHRKLHSHDQLIQDHELLGRSGIFVVLAEPGAGKTDLLEYFSESYGIGREQASKFVLLPPPQQPVVIIDSLDEVARIGEEKINEIIVKAWTSGANTVIFASRSYVWDEARTGTVHDCFGIAPTILRLEPFDEDEQRELFENYLPSENFDDFKSEVDRFELTPILGNPQFLKLFADAYVESGRRFSSKKQIYTDAVRRLANERRNAAGATERPPIDAIVAAASEIFAKLLLSGATGVSASEEIGDDAYPYLRSVALDDDMATFVLNSRLFKPTGSVNQHDPVHRIVAEYCAADYLVKRIEDATNTFSVRRCLAVIAPNSTVRDELRGLLGWMASLGGRTIQEAIIDLDPYTVFANGDASQLLASSKKRLLDGLKSLADIDPFFRRMDSWRRFNVAGFFSTDIIEQVRPLLASRHSGSHLRGLLLELLHGTETATGLEQEFRTILRDSHAQEIERVQAFRNLLAMRKGQDRADFNLLVSEASRDSLDLASRMLRKHGYAHFGAARTLSFMKKLAELYPADHPRERIAGSRYFIGQVVATFSLSETRTLLNKLTLGLACSCGPKRPHRCTCRRGKSKIIGYLLDRYFEVICGPHDPRQITQWTTRLIFRGQVRRDRSTSVEALSANAGLRRAIQLSGFAGLSEQGEIGDAFGRLYAGSSHAGLALREGDYQALVDHAFETKNYPLWRNLIVRHNPYAEHKGPDELRARMRSQARQSKDWLSIWSKVDRDHRELSRQQFVRFGRSNKRYAHLEEKRKAYELAHYNANRAQIETGRHWGWLQQFAQRYLHGLEEGDQVISDPKIVEDALLNCFDFLAPEVPSLATLADQRGTAIAMVLEAASLAVYRKTGSLDDIPLNMLRAVKSQGVGGNGYREGEMERFITELDRLLFTSDADAKDFATQFLEPQLTRANEIPTHVSMLDHASAFNSVKGELSLDWLARYPLMPWHAQETLFGIAAVHADRAGLNALIETRCNDPIDPSEDGVRRRNFWLLRHFFFIVPTSPAHWAEFSSDRTAILRIEQYAGRMGRHDSQGWPHLTAEKTYRVLDRFVAEWPKVPLPQNWGTGDPPEETAYRFLADAVSFIGRDDPANSIPIYDRLLADARFDEFQNAIKATGRRQLGNKRCQIFARRARLTFRGFWIRIRSLPSRICEHC